MMNLKNNEIVRVRVTTGKAKKWWATDNVAKKDLENYKAMTTTDLRNYCIKPTTTINFEIYEIDYLDGVSTGCFVDGAFRSIIIRK